MSLRGVAVGMLTDGFPRVSGDEPALFGGEADDARFSPRERG